MRRDRRTWWQRVVAAGAACSMHDDGEPTSLVVAPLSFYVRAIGGRARVLRWLQIHGRRVKGRQLTWRLVKPGSLYPEEVDAIAAAVFSRRILRRSPAIALDRIESPTFAWLAGKARGSPR